MYSNLLKLLLLHLFSAVLAGRHRIHDGVINTATGNISSVSEGRKVLVLYSYFETTHGGYASKSNLQFLLKHGLTSNSDVTFVFIINSRHHTVQFPNQSNLIVYPRQNLGYEFGAYSDYIEHNLQFVQGFDAYICMQSSLRGPFQPNYETRHWTSLLTDELSENVKLVGTTINCMDAPHTHLHLQGPLLVTDPSGLEVLRPLWNSLLKPGNASKDKAIAVEIESTKVLLAQGWNIASNMLFWKGVDFQDHSEVTRKCKWILDNTNAGAKRSDVYYSGSYASIDVNPLEMIFFKVNRGVNPRQLERYTQFANDV